MASSINFKRPFAAITRRKNEDRDRGNHPVRDTHMRGWFSTGQLGQHSACLGTSQCDAGKMFLGIDNGHTHIGAEYIMRIGQMCLHPLRAAR